MFIMQQEFKKSSEIDRKARVSLIFEKEVNESENASTSCHIETLDQLKHWMKRDEKIVFSMLQKIRNDYNEIVRSYSLAILRSFSCSSEFVKISIELSLSILVELSNQSIRHSIQSLRLRSFLSSMRINIFHQ